MIIYIIIGVIIIAGIGTSIFLAERKKKKGEGTTIVAWIPIIIGLVLALIVGTVKHFEDDPVVAIQKILHHFGWDVADIISTPAPMETIATTEEQTITKEEQDKQEIAELFVRYANDFVNAVNYQDFSYVEQTMIEGSPMYNTIKDYVSTYCKQNGVHETLVDQKISIYTPNGDDSYYIDTYEVYDIQTNQSKQVNRRTFNAQYIVKKENGKWYMSEYTIEHKPYN